MVFRRSRRGNALRPVNRIKHVVDQQGGTTAGTQSGFQIIRAVDAPVIGNVQEVNTGATVNAIYLKVEAYATTAGALANFYIFIDKNPGGNLTFPNGNVIGSNDNKKYVIHQTDQITS